MANPNRWHRPVLASASVLAGVVCIVVAAIQPDSLGSLNQHVSQLNRAGKYTEATKVAQRAFAIAERQFGPDHSSVGTTLNNLAELYWVQGRYGEAEPLYKRALAIREKALGPDHASVGTTLNNLAVLYENQGRFTEAEPLYKRTLGVFEKALGPDHPRVGATLNNLAQLYRAQGRYGEAEPLYKRDLAITEQALGPDHPDVGGSLNNLAGLYKDQGRYTDAEPLFKRSLIIMEKALNVDHADVGKVLTNLASLYQAQGRFTQAEPIYKRAIKILEKGLGADHWSVGTSLNDFAELYRSQGRYAEAEPLYMRALAIREKALGTDHPDVGQTLNNLALLYSAQGRYAGAERLYKRDLAITEQALGPNHPTVGTSLNNLALLYLAQGRYADAEPLYQRSLNIREEGLGLDHPDVANSLNNLALLYDNQGRYAEAEKLYKRSLAIREAKLGPDHPDVANALNNLALLHDNQGRYVEAEPIHRRSLAIRETALAPDHPDVANSLHNLAMLYGALGRYPEAEPLYNRSLDITERTLGPDHPSLGTSLNNHAMLAFSQRDWRRAVDDFRRGTDVFVRRTKRSGKVVGQALRSTAKTEALRTSGAFKMFVKAAFRLTKDEPARRPALSQEMFRMAQWGQGSEAASALAQMAARQAKGAGALGRLVRERQDSVVEWQAKDKRLTAARSRPPDERNADVEQALARRLAEIDARIAEIDRTLAKDFPNYATIASPEPLSIEDAQAELRADEVLVLFLDTPEWTPTQEETFIWVVTKTASHWIRAELGTETLAKKVAALRGAMGVSGTIRAAVPIGESGQRGATLFVKQAHDLYQALLGRVADELESVKTLIIVPSGPLTSLPWHLLVTKRPDPTLSGVKAYRKAAWLIRTHGVSVLPSVASLRAIRQHANSGGAPQPFIGIGNPLLLGSSGSDKSAWDYQQCSGARNAASIQVAARDEGGTLQGITSYFRGSQGNIEVIRRMAPLPETAGELCAVGRGLRAGHDAIYLGENATETKVKQLSDDGKLAMARVVHFATHGLVSGELKHLAEPALVLTPPEENDTDSAGDNDGLLTASEVTQLKLNADWVILSACNTASSGEGNAEPHSGLARAFFYAGARTLLVSHWPVNSEAAVELTTRTFDVLKRNPETGRAEALRRAMLSLIDKGAPHEAHPSYWAPFVVVGEGGADG